jgi:hypothetical protein
MAESIKKTSLLLPEDLLWQVKELAVKRRISDTAAMREALNLWVGVGAYPECANLAHILQDGTERGRSFRQKLLPILRAWTDE